MTLQEEINQAINNGKMMVFEIPVVRKTDSSKDYILCDIYINNDKIECNRDALTYFEEHSQFIPYNSIIIDPDFGLDYHLASLYESVINSIIESDFYNLV